MKSLFRGSAAIAAAILLSSFLLSARPSIAETLISSFQKPTQELSQSAQENPKQDPMGQDLSSSLTSSTVATTKATTEVKPNTMPAAEAVARTLSATPVVIVAATSSKALPPAAELRAMPNTVGATYTATAYSLSGRTASGVRVSKGLIAADPRVLPLGTRVRLEAGAYSGEYLVADTGGAVRGKRIDIWTPSTREALRFGRRPVRLTVLSCPPKRASASRHPKK